MTTEPPGRKAPSRSHARSALVAAVAKLARLYDSGINRSPTGPFEMILWENIGYLVDDQRRGKLFEEFEARIGLSASAIAAAPNKLLLDIAQGGGMRPEERVAKWRRIAGVTTECTDGNLNTALKGMAPAKAVALLKAYPSIGEPGADKIMLLSGLDARPALESNGLRTLLRLGLIKEGKSYAATYRAAKMELTSHGRPTREWFVSAFQSLKAHGQALCKRSVPLCVTCPLSKACPKKKLNGLY